MSAAATSFRLCGGMSVAMPTAMPDVPLSRMLGRRAGRITGSVVGADPADSPIEWGYVKGDLIVLKVKMMIENVPQPMVYIGKLGGDGIEFGRRPENLAIGRLVEFLKSVGQWHNTLFILMSDNGASQEGGPFGMVNAMGPYNLRREPMEEKIARIDDIGGPDTHSNFPLGWAMAQRDQAVTSTITSA